MKRRPLLSSYLFYHHSELALPAEDRFDPWEPLYIREDFGRTNQNLTWVETICLVEEQALTNKDTIIWIKTWDHIVDDWPAEQANPTMHYQQQISRMIANSTETHDIKFQFSIDMFCTFMYK